MHRKAIFREVFNADLGHELSSGVCWSLERRAIRCYRPARSLWNIPGVEEQDNHKHNHIIGVYPSGDGVLTAAVGSNGTVRVHEPGDVEDSYRLELKLPDSIAATWGHDDRLYIALAYRPKIWRFDLESCETHKPSQQLVLPEHNIGSAASGLSDMTLLGKHILAVTMTNGMAFVLDERLKRSAVLAVRVSQNSGTSKPPAITATNPFLITGARGCISVFDIRRLPPATYGNVLTHMRTLGGGGASAATTSTSAISTTPITMSGADFGTIHLAPGSTSTIAFQLASGHIGVADLLGSGRNAKVKIESATPRMTSAAVSTELMDYGATYSRVAMDAWWVHRRRCTITAAPHGIGWRFYAPLVHGSGFRVMAINGSTPTKVHTVKTAERVTSVSALGQYGGCASLAVGYSRLGVDLYQSDMRNEQQMVDEIS